MDDPFVRWCRSRGGIPGDFLQDPRWPGVPSLKHPGECRDFVASEYPEAVPAFDFLWKAFCAENRPPPKKRRPRSPPPSPDPPPAHVPDHLVWEGDAILDRSRLPMRPPGR